MASLSPTELKANIQSALGGFAAKPLPAAARELFGVLGYICVKLECEPAPMILGFILGPLMEENLRRAMLLSRGDPMTFVTKPISAGFIIASVFLLVIVALPAIRKKREQVFVEEQP